MNLGLVRSKIRYDWGSFLAPAGLSLLLFFGSKQNMAMNGDESDNNNYSRRENKKGRKDLSFCSDTS